MHYLSQAIDIIMTLKSHTHSKAVKKRKTVTSNDLFYTLFLL